MHFQDLSNQRAGMISASSSYNNVTVETFLISSRSSSVRHVVLNVHKLILDTFNITSNTSESPPVHVAGVRGCVWESTWPVWSQPPTRRSPWRPLCAAPKPSGCRDWTWRWSNTAKRHYRQSQIFAVAREAAARIRLGCLKLKDAARPSERAAG